MEIFVYRLLRERGTIMGTLKVVKEVAGEENEQVKVCGTVEREADCLPAGKYRVCIGKCIYHHRKMPFLVPMDSSQCELCCKARHSHEFGDISAFASLPCAMIQPGNGPFTMSRGSILVGEVHAPGYVLKSQSLFTTLYDAATAHRKRTVARLNHRTWQGGEG